MKVILRQQVENLGRPGEIVNVKPGFANNFLIPNQMALLVTPSNLNRVEHEKRQLAAKEAKLKSEAEAILQQFAGTTLHFTRKAGMEGVLYGSVTASEIAEAMVAKGLEIDKRRLIIAEPIKRIGEFVVRTRLHPEVELQITVRVESEDGEIAAAPVEEKGSEEKPAADVHVEESTEAVQTVEQEEATQEAETAESHEDTEMVADEEWGKEENQ